MASSLIEENRRQLTSAGQAFLSVVSLRHRIIGILGSQIIEVNVQKVSLGSKENSTDQSSATISQGHEISINPPWDRNAQHGCTQCLLMQLHTSFCKHSLLCKFPPCNSQLPEHSTTDHRGNHNA
jgi:hypothetical protein